MNKIELLNQLLQLTVWLPIKDYPNYEVSICGQVRNIKTKRILMPGMSDGYYHVVLCKNNSKKNHKIHRLVANTFLPKIDVTKNYVDHIDNNRLNNTISNLRWCSSQENNRNRSLSSKNTSGVKGVIWYKRDKKWVARIMINYKIIHIGYFDNIDDAKIARQNKSTELFGIFQNNCEK
jgi:hypothetical protein